MSMDPFEEGAALQGLPPMSKQSTHIPKFKARRLLRIDQRAPSPQTATHLPKSL
jgi:hypothetical protein